MRALLAVFAERDLALLPWADRMARRLGSDDLVLLCVTEDPVRQTDEVHGSSDRHSELARAAAARVAADELGAVSLLDCRGPKPSTAVLDEIRDLDGRGHVLILPADLDDRPGRSGAAIQRLMHVAPVDVLLLDVGAVAPGPERVVVAQYGGGGGLAMRVATRACSDSLRQLVAVADSDALPRSKRVFQKVQERMPEDRAACANQVIPTESMAASVRQEVAAGDLVLVEAETTRELRRILKYLAGVREARPDAALAIGVVRSDQIAGPGRLERLIQQARTHLPRLNREQRRDVHDLLEQGGRLSTNFVVMLMLSTAIATLGLIQSSTATVVGAMLVAPLMTPIIALGLSLAQANLQLFRAALHAVAVGIGAALLTACLLAMLSPWSDLSAEVVARGSPNLFDLGIALLSGVAGSYAIARPGAVGALVGVAIAVALVPPLASVGIATIKSEYGVALGAATLFGTNLISIVAGSAIVFRLLGMDTQGRLTPRWVRVANMTIAVVLLPIVAALVSNLQDQIRSGVHRAYARPLPPHTRAAIEERVAQSAGVEIVLMAESEIEHGFGAELVLSCARGVDEALAVDLRTILTDHLGERVVARILWVLAAEAR